MTDQSCDCSEWCGQCNGDPWIAEPEEDAATERPVSMTPHEAHLKYLADCEAERSRMEAQNKIDDARRAEQDRIARIKAMNEPPPLPTFARPDTDWVV